MGEVVGLSIKVFRDEMEKFLKFYQVSDDSFFQETANEPP